MIIYVRPWTASRNHLLDYQYVMYVKYNTILIVLDWDTMGGCGNATFPNDILICTIFYTY